MHIPAIDIDRDSPKNVQKALKTALFGQGCLYVALPHRLNVRLSFQNTLSQTDLLQLIRDDLLAKADGFFDWEDKRTLVIENTCRFLGYSCDDEATENIGDHKEIFDAASELLEMEDPRYLFQRMRGPSQWPPERAVPGFREIVTEFERESTAIANRLLESIEQTLQLPSISNLYGELQPQHRMKLVRYPRASQADNMNRECGAHTDGAEWMNLIHQTGQTGLELPWERQDGQCDPMKPLAGHMMVLYGQPLQDATDSVVECRHRVEVHQLSSNFHIFSLTPYSQLSTDAT